MNLLASLGPKGKLSLLLEGPRLNCTGLTGTEARAGEAQGRPGETAASAELPGGRPVAAGRCCKLKCPSRGQRWASVAGTGAEAAQAAEHAAAEEEGATELSCCSTKKRARATTRSNERWPTYSSGGRQLYTTMLTVRLNRRNAENKLVAP